MIEISGAPERLSCLAASHLDERHHAAIEQLRLMLDYPEGQPLHSFYAILAHSPDLFATYMDFGVAIAMRTGLPTRWRELLILRTGWLCGAPYQWGEHVITAHQAGLTHAEIERVTIGADAEGLDTRDTAILRAAEELHASSMICDETWATLASFLDERQLLEVPMVVGHYHTTAYVQNALRVALNDHNPGLSAR